MNQISKIILNDNQTLNQKTKEFEKCLNGVHETTNLFILKESEKFRILIPVISEWCATHGYRWLGDKEGYFIRKYMGVYATNVYQSLGKLIENYYNLCQLFPTDRNINEVRKHIERNYSMDPSEFENDHRYIVFPNFAVPLWGDDAFTPVRHPTHLKTLISIPHEYNPDAKCPKWDSFMHVVSDGMEDPKVAYETLWEIMGYCMQFSVKMKKAFLIVSKESNTGKSTYLNVLTALVGDNNVSKIRLDKLTNLSFGAGGASHKLLNYYDDLPRYIKVETLDVWKSQIDGKSLDFEKKFKDSDKHANILKQIYASNGLPKLAWDLTIAIRLLILIFKHVFLPKSKGGDMIKHWEIYQIIQNEDEMEGIVIKALDALERLFKRGEFQSASAEDVLHFALMNTDIIYRFLHECCLLGRKFDKDFKQKEGTFKEQWFHQKQGDLYNRFTQYQTLEGDNTKISRRIFTRALKKHGIHLKQSTMMKRVEAGFEGIYESQEHVNIYLGAQFFGFPQEYNMEEAYE